MLNNRMLKKMSTAVCLLSVGGGLSHASLRFDNAESLRQTMGRGIQDGLITEQKCVQGKFRLKSSGHGSFSIFNGYGEEKKSDSARATVNVEGEAFFGLVSASYEASKESSDSEQVLEKSYEKRLRLELLSASLSNVRLLDESCPPYYLSNVVLGAELDIVATLHFAKQEDLYRFEQKYEVSALFDAIEHSGNLNEESRNLIKDATFDVKINQRGGDTSTRLAIEGSDVAIGCRIERSVEACLALFKAYQKYAETVFNDLKNPTSSQEIDALLPKLEILSMHGLGRPILRATQPGTPPH